MALSELETAHMHKVVGEYMDRRRPPAHLRQKIDLGYRIQGQGVEIFEVSPAFSRPLEKVERLIAKATFVRSEDAWKVYWQRADLKWHRYEPVPTVKTLSEFLLVLEEDAHGCFWG